MSYKGPACSSAMSEPETATSARAPKLWEALIPVIGLIAMISINIFKFQGDRVIELWDLGQPVPESSPNENGMF